MFLLWKEKDKVEGITANKEDNIKLLVFI